MAHQQNKAIQCHSHWYRRQIKNRLTTKTKHNPAKANSVKYSKTKLAWFSHLIWHSARKWGGLILHCGP